VTASALSAFDNAWQQLPIDPSDDELYALLLLQLNAPSFAVPIAHPIAPGAKAYAQLLFIPRRLGWRIADITNRLAQEGRLVPVHPAQEDLYIGPHSCGVLVIRSDDPALPAAGQPEGADACLVGAP